MLTISRPQLDAQPLEPGGPVPRLPNLPVVGTQNSPVIPHWPQMLQQALRGQGLRSLILLPVGGCSVPGTVGPQMAPFWGAGKGASPSLKHILTPRPRLAQLSKPHVLTLLKFSTSDALRPLAAAILAQVSSFCIVYEAQVPLGSGLGRISGRFPDD